MARELPSLIGFRPEEAERAAAELGITLVWIDAPPPKWLPPLHEPRVGRQRLRKDGTLELLRVLAPAVDIPETGTSPDGESLV